MERDKQGGIQIARAVAALGIVYFHSWVAITRFAQDTSHPIPWLKDYGWLSVDLFFAISGYVIAIVVSRPGFQPSTFLIKRVFRLYPLWLAMLTTFAVTAWVWRGFQPRETFDFFLYSAALLPTLNSFPFYNIGWTLQHEMAFYLLAAIVVPLLGMRGLAAVLLASAIAVCTVDMPGHLAMYCSHHGEFLAGVLAFMMRDRLSRLGSLIPFALGAVLLGYLAVNAEGKLFPFALFLLIVAFANIKHTGEFAVRLGDASYSIYLIHPMVFFTASALVSKFPNAPLWTEEPIRFGCIGVALGLALLSWRYFEKPFIRFGTLVQRERSRRDHIDYPIAADA